MCLCVFVCVCASVPHRHRDISIEQRKRVIHKRKIISIRWIAGVRSCGTIRTIRMIRSIFRVDTCVLCMNKCLFVISDYIFIHFCIHNWQLCVWILCSKPIGTILTPKMSQRDLYNCYVRLLRGKWTNSRRHICVPTSFSETERNPFQFALVLV